MHRDRFLANETNRRTEFQIYWYYYSTCFGQPFCPSSGVLRRTSALVHFIQIWWPFATRSRMFLLLIANGHHNCIKCTNADVRLRTPDDWRKRLPETCRVVITINMEFSATVGFIHKNTHMLTKRNWMSTVNKCDRETEKWLLDGTEDRVGNEVIIQHKWKYIKTCARAKR